MINIMKIYIVFSSCCFQYLSYNDSRNYLMKYCIYNLCFQDLPLNQSVPNDDNELVKNLLENMNQFYGSKVSYIFFTRTVNISIVKYMYMYPLHNLVSGARIILLLTTSS